MKKSLAIIALLIVVCLSVSGLVACTSPSDLNGVYYLYVDGIKHENSYIQIRNATNSSATGDLINVSVSKYGWNQKSASDIQVKIAGNTVGETNSIDFNCEIDGQLVEGKLNTETYTIDIGGVLFKK